ncbi:LysR family transcriptional regulator [Cupriavidus necator]|uniref:LysR family transcriptional regulator n=1 Tax=Cupriavidus necator TaxID=106590 RepID=A0A367PHT4_CUPNE|nr:LysR family transcriptional regulator [Cupriavidus necator]QQX82840.1 LysR family transcriptional regulator [Cupriavidus necator]RCJ07420.1 LysR family transcriptional regulator [Cupriavidus necator]
MRIDDLRAFMLVAQHGSLHRATEHMGVTQSALSKALGRLEADAGMRLFERSPRGVTLTLVGESLLARARQVVLATHDFEQEVEAQRAARSGKIRLAATPYLVATVLTPVIARFLARRPLASFAVETRLTQGAIQALQSGEADFACGGLTADVPDDVCRAPLQPLHLRIVTREDHPRRPTFRTLADLVNERWALPQTSSSLYQVLADPFAELGLPPPRVAVEWTGSGVPIAELLRNTDLLGLLPHRTLTGPDGRGLCVIADGERLREPEVALLWRDDGYLSPLCLEFREALVGFSREGETDTTHKPKDLTGRSAATVIE